MLSFWMCNDQKPKTEQKKQQTDNPNEIVILDSHVF